MRGARESKQSQIACFQVGCNSLESWSFCCQVQPCSKLICLVENLKELVIFNIVWKSLKEGNDGFTQVCLLFEIALAAIMQEVPCSNEWHRELSRNWAFPRDLPWDPAALHVITICSMTVLPLELRAECFSWAMSWRYKGWIWGYLLMWHTIMTTSSYKHVLCSVPDTGLKLWKI